MPREYPWLDDEVISSEAKKKQRPTYPADHQVGMKVPKGGSDCAKCEYVSRNEKRCLNGDFQKWNGSEFLPAPADEYCCDFFEPRD